MLNATLRLIEAKRGADRTRALAKPGKALERKLEAIFKAQGKAVAASLTRFRSRFSEAAFSQDDVERLFSDAELETLSVFVAALRQAAETGLTLGAQALLDALGYDLIWSTDNPAAVAYIAQHGAEMVTRINEATRDNMRVLLDRAMTDGLTYNEVAAALQRQFAGFYDPNSVWDWQALRPQGHIDSRSHLIAVTELGNAYEAGNYQAAETLEGKGLKVVKMWSTLGDDRVSDGCLENEAAGWIGLKDEFPSGDQHPLRFPGCRCTDLYDVEVA